MFQGNMIEHCRLAMNLRNKIQFFYLNLHEKKKKIHERVSEQT